MNKKHTRTDVNVREKANLIWNIADIIRGPYKPHEYGKVILPLTVIKRFDDILRPTKQKVITTLKSVSAFEVKDVFLEKASGYSFYNTSQFTFENLLNEPKEIESNFRDYLNGFSENVQDILRNFDFDKQIDKLASNNFLYAVVQQFNKKNAYMGPDTITSTDMGYIFEELEIEYSFQHKASSLIDLKG